MSNPVEVYVDFMWKIFGPNYVKLKGGAEDWESEETPEQKAYNDLINLLYTYFNASSKKDHTNSLNKLKELKNPNMSSDIIKILSEEDMMQDKEIEQINKDEKIQIDEFYENLEKLKSSPKLVNESPLPKIIETHTNVLNLIQNGIEERKTLLEKFIKKINILNGTRLITDNTKMNCIIYSEYEVFQKQKAEADAKLDIHNYGILDGKLESTQDSIINQISDDLTKHVPFYIIRKKKKLKYKKKLLGNKKYLTKDISVMNNYINKLEELINKNKTFRNIIRNIDIDSKLTSPTFAMFPRVDIWRKLCYERK